MENKKVRHIKEIFEGDEEFAKLRNVVKAFDLSADFYEIFPQLKDFVKEAVVKNKMLFIKVEDSVLRHELYLKHEEMIKKINDYYNEPRIKAVRFY